MSGTGPSLRVQCVLYEQAFSQVKKLVEAVAASVHYARRTLENLDTRLAFGDCSPAPCLSKHEIASLQEFLLDGTNSGFTCEFFDANLGSAGGSNQLAKDQSETFILVLNPDTYPSPPLISRLLSVFLDQSVGCADARQIPLEHPKEYDLQTGDTSWASGSCLMVRSEVFRKVGGFDDVHFFLYCDDVDLSWRIRAAGYRVVHVPGAVVFHDKRLDSTGAVQPTRFESYYGVLGRLMLAQRYGRQDVLAETLERIRSTGPLEQRRALEEWEERSSKGQVPTPLVLEDGIAQFVGENYAVHRF